MIFIHFQGSNKGGNEKIRPSHTGSKFWTLCPNLETSVTAKFLILRGLIVGKFEAF